MLFVFRYTLALAYLSFWADLAAQELRLDFSSQCAKVPGAAVPSVTGFVDSLWEFSALQSEASVQEEYTYYRHNRHISHVSISVWSKVKVTAGQAYAKKDK